MCIKISLKKGLEREVKRNNLFCVLLKKEALSTGKLWWKHKKDFEDSRVFAQLCNKFVDFTLCQFLSECNFANQGLRFLIGSLLAEFNSKY